MPFCTTTFSAPTKRAERTRVNLLPADAMNSLVVATIDSDIANISDDNFGLVFAGGMAVMGGGVLSALIVGFILEKGDLYASVVADSYMQGAEDEDFWKGLSEEEKKKAQELLKKVKASKEGGSATNTNLAAAETTVVAASKDKVPVLAVKEEKQEVGMFSDYGDDA
jgi:hypothetical protein